MAHERLADSLVLLGYRLAAEPHPMDRRWDAHRSPAPEARGSRLPQPSLGRGQPRGMLDPNGHPTGTVEPAHILMHDIALQHIRAPPRRRIDVQWHENPLAGADRTGEGRARTLRRMDAPIGVQQAVGQPYARLLLQVGRPALAAFVVHPEHDMPALRRRQ